MDIKISIRTMFLSQMSAIAHKRYPIIFKVIMYKYMTIWLSLATLYLPYNLILFIVWGLAASAFVVAE
jgi:hypothetical protein